jgi:hypothetical protein
MPSCGIGLGLPYAGTGIDPDALSYFSRAGISSAALTPISYDSASTFNGSTQYLSVTNNSTLQVNNQSYTFSAWVNPSVSATQVIFGKFIGGTYDYLFFLDSTNKVQLGVLGSNLTSSASVPLGQWSHVACTYDHAGGQTARVYVNGQLSGTLTSFPSATSTTAEFQIGARAAQILFTGSIGPCAMWKRALSASEITSLYNSGNGLNYADVQSAGLTTNLVSYWALNETSGSRVDAAGSNTLTNNGSVGTTSRGPLALTFANSRALILDFVKGVKALGIWRNLVCWPLRSSQNAGTGTTAFSLGGAGTFNGTLTNGPTWGAGGVTKAASNDFISLPTPADFGLPTSSLSGGGILSTNAGVSGARPICFSGMTGTNDIHLRLNVATAPTLAFSFHSTRSGAVYFGPGGTSTRTTDFNFIHASVGQTTQSAYINGVLAQEATGLGAYNPVNVSENLGLLAKSASAETTFRGTMAFAYMIKSTEADAATISSLYTLYKNTLGVGLGLP